jgi:hypothetical protein
LSLKIILSFTKIEVLSLMVPFLYKVPNRAGFHQAKLLGEFKTGGFENNAITGATISPDASKVLLFYV